LLRTTPFSRIFTRSASKKPPGTWPPGGGLPRCDLAHDGIGDAADLGNALVVGRHHLFDDLFFELRAIDWHISIFLAPSVD
jgi:hypothetical protein